MDKYPTVRVDKNGVVQSYHAINFGDVYKIDKGQDRLARFSTLAEGELLTIRDQKHVVNAIKQFYDFDGFVLVNQGIYVNESLVEGYDRGNKVIYFANGDRANVSGTYVRQVEEMMERRNE